MVKCNICNCRCKDKEYFAGSLINNTSSKNSKLAYNAYTRIVICKDCISKLNLKINKTNIK